MEIVFFFLFRAYWNQPTYFFLGTSSVPLTLHKLLYTVHIFFIHVAFVSDIFKSPVPRKLGLMGYTRLCKR
jgi:hypothetical protein